MAPEIAPSSPRCQPGISRFDHEADLGYDTNRWEWIHDADEANPNIKKVIGARMGHVSYLIGDTVLLKAQARSEAWVAMICEFLEDDCEKVANFMWFSSEQEIKKRVIYHTIMGY